MIPTKSKTKYYVVWKGRKTGIFRNWEECSAQVSGYTNAEYQAFESKSAAEKAFQSQHREFKQKIFPNRSREQRPGIDQPIRDSYAVDAACRGNPGPLEFRCVHTQTGRVVFRKGRYAHGTNNVGEFLAIVQALMLFKKKGITQPIYSDSENAISWVRQKRCKTRLVRNEHNTELFDLIEKAENWLKDNAYPNPILKWKTRTWGQIPADFGRK